MAAEPDASAAWTPAHPTDVLLTLGRLQHGRDDPVQHRDEDGTVWRTARAAAGPATLRIRATGTGLEAAAWGPGAAAAVERAPDLLGARDDPGGFVPGHPLLQQAHRRFPGLRIARTGAVFEAVVAATIEQRVDGIVAMAAWQRLVRELGDDAPGPAPDGMRVFPDAGRWLALPAWRWHAAGVEGRRAETIRAAARVAPSLERLADRDAAAADAALRSVAGVGAWTAAEVRQRALGDADAVSIGDFHLAAMVGSALAGRPFDDAELLVLLEPWRGHRYRVARLLYALGIETAPRRGPRRPGSDHRRR